MSDWGAVHSTVASALAGLDQESGEQLDTENFFEAPLARRRRRTAPCRQSRLDDMARRIVGFDLRQRRLRRSAPAGLGRPRSRAIGPRCKSREKASCC